MTRMTSLVLAAQIAAAVFAVFAAILWHMSAVVKLPDLIPPDAETSAGAHKNDGAGSFKNIFAEDMEMLTCALRSQSRYSKWAAFYAGLAAALQASVIVLQM